MQMIRACVHFMSLTDNQPVELYFKDPVAVLTAKTTEEVKSVIKKAEQYSSEHYVVGYTAYEAAAAFSNKMTTKSVETYAKFYVFSEPVKPFEETMLMMPMEFQFHTSPPYIMSQIETIKSEIIKGNTYQVNYTVRLSAQSDNQPYAVYQRLTTEHNGQYTAYIEDGEEAVISISPELFFEYDKNSGHIYTKPMKGTMPRNGLDDKNARLLKKSLKDQAENVMIVDLLRSDLSRIAIKNSVAVTSLFEITAYETVYQMTSTIEADVTGASLVDIFSALYPCGSITGAPKISTMAIIDALEEEARDVYCGAVGMMLPDGRMIFNVPIRTLKKQGRTYAYGVGGGITIDSIPEKEYDEMIAKTKILTALAPADFHLIETMRVDENGVKRRDYHRQRLLDSLNHFHLSYDPVQLEALLSLTAAQTKMLRVTASEGRLLYELRDIPATSCHAVLMPMLEEDSDRLQHKTSIRHHYVTKSQTLSLYYNKDNIITEFNIGNLVYELDGKLYTPDVPQMLRGCMRQELLDRQIISIRNLTVDALLSHQTHIKLWMINSLREWTEIHLDRHLEIINSNSRQKSVE